MPSCRIAREAGTLRNERTSKKSSGIKFHGVIQKIWFSLCSSLPVSTLWTRLPSRTLRIVNTMAAMRKEGTVVHSMARICVKTSTFAS